MKITKLLLVCLCCLMAASAAWGQAASSAARTGILGYLDPHTGAFRPLPPVADDAADLPALTTFTGTINLTITVTVKSTGLTNILCSADVFVEDAITTGARVFSETNSVSATGSGSTKTCKLSIPYSWGLSTQSSDTMTTSYSVVGSASATNGLPTRSSGLSPVDSRKVPSSGTITTLTASVTL